MRVGGLLSCSTARERQQTEKCRCSWHELFIYMHGVHGMHCARHIFHSHSDTHGEPGKALDCGVATVLAQDHACKGGSEIFAKQHHLASKAIRKEGCGLGSQRADAPMSLVSRREPLAL
jgi:hypothetical protein